MVSWNWATFFSPWALTEYRPYQVPHVNRTDYQLIDISEDGFVRIDAF